MNPGMHSIDQLAHQVGALAAAAGPSDVFRLLLEGARIAGPRAAMFLLRKGEIKGWGSVGYPTEVAVQQRSYTAAMNAGWFGALASDPTLGVEERTSVAADPAFGQSPAAESAAVAVRVKERTIAILLIERAPNEQPWYPSAIGLLVEVARLRLDLDLALRKLESRGHVAAPALDPAPQPTAVAPAAPVRPPAHTETKEIAPAVEPAPALTPEMEAVHRYAKLVATDIRLYNEEAVVQGRQQRDLVQRLGEQLAQGKETFQRRYATMGTSGLEILHRACVQVLAGGDEELIPFSTFEKQPTT